MVSTGYTILASALDTVTIDLYPDPYPKDVEDIAVTVVGP